MARFVVALTIFTLSTAVALTYLLPTVSSTPNLFVGLLAAACALVFGYVAATGGMSAKARKIGWSASAAALVILLVGLATSLVVNGTVVAYTATQAKLDRQIHELAESTQMLHDAEELLSATPAERFARAGAAKKMSSECENLLRSADRTAPVVPEMTASIVALKQGASSCAQGLSVSASSSATPDEQTSAAISQAASDVTSSITAITDNNAAVAATYGLGEVR